MKQLGIVLLALILGSCNAQRDGSEWSGTFRRVGRAELVLNPQESLRGGVAAPTSPAWVAPSRERSGGSSAWQEPKNVRVADSMVYVLDPMANQLYGVEVRTGSWTLSLGSTGRGPGELERPFGFDVVGDTVIVGNGGAASLELFGRTGKYVRSVPLGRMGFSIGRFGPNTVLVSAFLGSAGGSYVVSTGTGNATLFEWPKWLSGEDHACHRVTSDSAFVYRLDCSRLAYQVLDHMGQLARQVVVDRPLEEPTEAQVQVAVQHIREEMAKSRLPSELIEHQVAEEKKRLQAMRVMRAIRPNPTTGQVAVWEQLPEELGPGNATLQVFDNKGRYLESIRFNASWVDFDWDGSRLYELEREQATGLVRLVAWDLNVAN